jgi:hypothetical protein
MKKLILTLSLFTLFHLVFGQQVKFALTGGGNLSTLSYASPSLALNGIAVSTSSIVGFNIGAAADIPVGAFSIQPALLFTTKGYKITENVTDDEGSSTVSGTATLNYIELPLNIFYNLPVGKTGKIFFGGGPYIAYGVGGTFHSDNTNTSTSVKFGNGEDDNFGNLDFGISVSGGFRFSSGLFFSVGHDLGLSNIETKAEAQDDPGSNMKNRSAHLSIGYFFK